MAAKDARMELTSKRHVEGKKDDEASAKRQRRGAQQQEQHARQQRQQELTATDLAESAGADAPPASPHRRHQNYEQQQQHEPTTGAVESAPGGAMAMLTALEARVNVARETRELVYKDSTRVLIGPGFMVREVLFGKEAASVRVAAAINDTTVAFLRSPAALDEIGAALRKATEVVEVMEIDKKTAAAARAKTSELRSITVHLNSKHELEPFCEALQLFQGRVDGFAVEGVDTTLSHTDWCPPALRDVTRTGSLSISWALGPGSGTARLVFSTASDANVFLSCFLAGQFEDLKRAEISLVGYVDDVDMSTTERQREQEKKRSSPYLPPLKTVVFQERVQVFDEAKINAMDPSAVLALRFEARVHTGLPAQIDAVELAKRLHPHDMEVFLDRNYDASAARTMDTTGHLFAPLAESLVSGEELHFAEDPQQASVTVHFANINRLDEVKRNATESLLWSTIERPFGSLPRLSVLYKWCATLAEDIRACFYTELVHVRAFARIHGVSWQETNAGEEGTHKVLTLESRCLHTVNRVVEKIKAAITSELFFDPALSAAFMTIREWKKFTQELKTKSPTGKSGATSCIRENLRLREIQVYGTKDQRREKINEIKKKSLPYRPVPRDDCCVCKKLPDPAEYVNFTACEHTACPSCIRLGITPSTPLPLRCPAEGCGREMDVNDVIKIATNVDALVELAVFDYVAKHADEYALCPQPGCYQILQRPKLGQLTDDEETPRAQFTACESCHGSYCLVCSDTFGWAVDAHGGSTSKEALVCPLNVDWHVYVIRNQILTLTCPHCKCAFVDFKDGLSVSCTNITCARQVCVCCLTYSNTNAKLTARHVRNCMKKVVLRRSDDAADWLRGILCNHRQRRLKTYLETKVDSLEARRLVLESLGQDLSDLGLAMTV